VSRGTPSQRFLLLSLKRPATEAENFDQEAMSIDFAALTQAVVAGLADVRSCLMVSRDGLALGASPAIEEGRTLDVWTRISALGEVERGFVTVRDEVWVFCRRGAYGAVAIGTATARPGPILDSLEQMALRAEESRVRKEGFRPAERESSTADTPRGPRTTLHRDRAPTSSPESSGKLPDTAIPGEPYEPEREIEEAPERGARDATPVDRAELSREFAGILAEHEEEEA
jgi:hypothetical protein